MNIRPDAYLLATDYRSACVMDGIGDGKTPAACAGLLTPLHLRRSVGVFGAGDLVEVAARARELLSRS